MKTPLSKASDGLAKYSAEYRQQALATGSGSPSVTSVRWTRFLIRVPPSMGPSEEPVQGERHQNESRSPTERVEPQTMGQRLFHNVYRCKRAEEAKKQGHYDGLGILQAARDGHWKRSQRETSRFVVITKSKHQRARVRLCPLSSAAPPWLFANATRPAGCGGPSGGATPPG